MPRAIALLCAIAAGLAGPAPALVIPFDDGGTHNINDNTYLFDSIRVTSGTTVNIVSLGTVGLDPSVFWSVQAEGDTAGSGTVNQTGGSTTALIEARARSCITLSGGFVGESLAPSGSTSLLAGSATGFPAVARVEGAANLASRVAVASNSRITITGGTIGADPAGESLRAQALNQEAVVTITGGTFEGALAALGRSRVSATNTTFQAKPATGIAVRVHGGAFSSSADISGILSVGPTSWVDVSTGVVGGPGQYGISIGSPFLNPAVLRIQDVFTTRIQLGTGGQLDMQGGTTLGTPGIYSKGAGQVFSVGGSANILGGIQARDGTYGRVDGGSVADGGGCSIHCALVVGADSAVPPALPSVVEVFGGTIGGIDVGPGGTVHMYGTNLAKGMFSLSGTLADGTPMTSGFRETGDGQILLHTVNEIPGFSPFTIPLAVTEALVQLPVSIRPNEPDCLGASVAPPAAYFEPLLNGLATGGGNAQYSLEIDMVDSVVNPGAPTFEATGFGIVDDLRLQSADPVDLGFGPETLYLTVQSRRDIGNGDPTPGPEGGAFLTYAFDTQTFDGWFEVFYDIRRGNIAGPIVHSGSDTVSVSGIPWKNGPPDNLLPGVPVGEFSPGNVAGRAIAFRFQGTDLDLAVMTPVSGPPPVPALGPGGALVAALLLACAAAYRLRARRIGQ